MKLRNKVSKKSINKIVFLCCFSLLICNTSDSSTGSYPHIEDVKFLVKKGKNLQKNGEFLEAISVFEEALGSPVINCTEEQKLECLEHLGILCWNLGKLDRSRDYYDAAFELAEKLNLDKEISRYSDILAIMDHYDQGRDFNRQGMFVESISCYEKALDVSIQVKSLEHELKCLRQLSITYWDISNLDRFFALNEQGLQIARELNHKAEIGRALNNIGLYYSQIGNYSMSLSKYLDALTISRQVNNRVGITNNLNNIANVYMNLGNYKRSLEYLTEALKIDEKAGDERYISMDLNNLGELYRRMATGKRKSEFLNKALENFMKCLYLARKVKDKSTEIISLNNIGNIYLSLGEFKSALTVFREALANLNGDYHSESVSMLLCNIGFVFLNLNKLEKAENYFNNAISIASSIGAVNVLWESFFGLGLTYERGNKIDNAISSFRKSIELIDHIRSKIVLDVQQAGYVRNKLKVYENLIELYYKLYLRNNSQKLIAEMFNIVEKAKSRALLDLLNESEINIRQKLNLKLRRKEEEISDKISNTLSILASDSISEKERRYSERSLLDAENEYVNFISKMRIEIPELAEMISPSPYSLDQIQDHLLNERTALLEYYLGEKQSFVFLVTKKNVRISALASRSEIHNSIRAFIKLLGELPNSSYLGSNTANRLYKELIKPVLLQEQQNLTHFIIIPDGSLFYLPFETLVSDIRTLDSIITRYSFSYMPSASSLLFLKKLSGYARARKDILAIGNPNYRSYKIFDNKKTKHPAQILLELYQSLDYKLSPIPFSEKEVKKVCEPFKLEKYDILLRNDANETALKSLFLEDYNIIHFACHGFLDEIFPFRSALVLSLNENSKEDGFLQVREIYNLRMKAELVVLSACQTGRGRLEYGEGVLGLPRIFFYAGARSVISTLWRIGDKATAKFMEIFYKYLSKGHSKAEALRLTKLAMINSKYSHPFYWAAFVLNGDYKNSIF